MCPVLCPKGKLGLTGKMLLSFLPRLKQISTAFPLPTEHGGKSRLPESKPFEFISAAVNYEWNMPGIAVLCLLNGRKSGWKWLCE